jgi:uncharacterized membrane protein YhaH (DUF805 family)
MNYVKSLIAEFIINYFQIITNWKWSGTNTRREYVMFLIGNICMVIYTMQIDIHLGLYSPYWGMGPFYTAYTALVFWPGWCLAARRLRDVGYPPMRLWWLAVPVVGWMLVTYWLLFKPSRSFPYNSKRALQLS